ncbi:PREDICTED: putative clathrin assembly protein At4g40080 [Fragaria vesca subsp. vesca]|uniref:putative clathrin assembly protein At4g40080 n=1 Tax=Fragaria vesca subsp. vesca TaxID=101020 RepID=UPI0002C2E68C|nr:PREDICTED: putative clathrin assembly protein At4g40080 [Fragaria vesca subsp. vesca]
MDRKINFIDVLKDKASILRASFSINRHVSSIHVSILRATSHDPSSPPSEDRINDILELGKSSRLAACTCIDILMDRLHATQNAFVALKCLFTVHNIVSRGSLVFRDQISYHPSFGGRNFLNMAMFSDKSDMDTWEFSLWVRWYAAVVEQNMTAARVIGYYLNPPHKFAEYQTKTLPVLNNDLVNEIEALIEFVVRISDPPESLNLQRNNLVYEIVKAASEDYRAVQYEISVRVKETEERVERLCLSELTRVVDALRRLEDCKERLVLLFVNRKRNEGLWESVRKTSSELAETKAQREEKRLVVRTMSRNRGRDDMSESTQCWNPFLEPGQLLLLPSGRGGGGGWLGMGPSPIAV